MLALVEPCIGIVCACIPVLRPVFRPIFTKVSSRLSSSKRSTPNGQSAWTVPVVLFFSKISPTKSLKSSNTFWSSQDRSTKTYEDDQRDHPMMDTTAHEHPRSLNIQTDFPEQTKYEQLEMFSPGSATLTNNSGDIVSPMLAQNLSPLSPQNMVYTGSPRKIQPFEILEMHRTAAQFYPGDEKPLPALPPKK